MFLWYATVSIGLTTSPQVRRRTDLKASAALYRKEASRVPRAIGYLVYVFLRSFLKATAFHFPASVRNQALSNWGTAD